jgi:hypothetical protein
VGNQPTVAYGGVPSPSPIKRVIFPDSTPRWPIFPEPTPEPLVNNGPLTPWQEQRVREILREELGKEFGELRIKLGAVRGMLKLMLKRGKR